MYLFDGEGVAALVRSRTGCAEDARWRAELIADSPAIKPSGALVIGQEILPVMARIPG